MTGSQPWIHQDQPTILSALTVPGVNQQAAPSAVASSQICAVCKSSLQFIVKCAKPTNAHTSVAASGISDICGADRLILRVQSNVES
jgi:hypothetical protein